MKRLLVAVLLASLAGCFGHAEVRSEGAPQALVERGEAHLKAGRYEEARRAFEAALAADRSLLAAHRGLAHAYFELGRLSQLEDRYRKALSSDPNDAFAAYGLAIVRYAESSANAGEALKLLERVDTLRPGLADVSYRMGLIHLDAERWKEAAWAFGRAVALDPRNPAYRAPYALALYHLGEPRRALDALSGLLELHPRIQDVEKARRVAERINDPFRDLPKEVKERIHQGIGWLERADVPQNAIDIFREILLDHPDLAIVHSLLGLAYQRIGSGGEALTHLRRAVELAPDLPQPHLYLANFYFGRDRFEEATAEYEEALRRNPLLLEAHVLLARLAADHGDRPRALRHLDAWSTLEPDNPAPRLERARLLAQAGDLDGAERALSEVLRIDPSHLEAHLSLATIWHRRYQLAKTEEARQAAAEETRRHAAFVLDAQPDNAAAARLLEDLE